MRSLTPSRLIAALAVLGLAATTVLAASPSPSASTEPSGSAPSASAAASAASSTGASAAAASAAAPSASPSVASAAPTATKAPAVKETEEADEDGPPSAERIAEIVAKLKAAGITTTASAFEALATKAGVGGAVRTLAFAKASGKTPAQILAMFDGGKGWGQIRHELNLSIGPGIGWIMGGGHGHGKGNAP